MGALGTTTDWVRMGGECSDPAFERLKSGFPAPQDARDLALCVWVMAEVAAERQAAGAKSVAIPAVRQTIRP